MWMNLPWFNVRSTSSSATYARIRGCACFRLEDKKKTRKKVMKTNTKFASIALGNTGRSNFGMK